MRRWNVHGTQLLMALLGCLLAARLLAAPAVQHQDGISWVEARGGTAYLNTGGPASSKPRRPGLALVDFSNRPIGDAELEGIGGLGPIYGLDLTKTRITDAALKSVAVIGSLERLSMDDTEIGDRGLAALSPLKKLQRLSLSGTKVTSAGIQALGPLAALRTIILDGTAVDDRGIRSLASNAPNLEELSLAHTLVADPGFASGSTFRRLRALSLTGTGVSGIGLRGIALSSNLESLQLDGTRVTSADLTALEGLNGLKILSWTTPRSGTRRSHFSRG